MTSETDARSVPSEGLTQENNSIHQDNNQAFLNEVFEGIDSDNANDRDKEGDQATSPSILINIVNLGNSLNCNETDKLSPVPDSTCPKQAPLHSENDEKKSFSTTVSNKTNNNLNIDQSKDINQNQ